ncbi:MAG TPA: TonB-dependent receptor plug domain-containing protein, partial [Candidatus Synoicihabitans sp.]|nr:TonB-dependent receptor plug domain-containing protein [Candidatus Synoicihabitans sp.]
MNTDISRRAALTVALALGLGHHLAGQGIAPVTTTIDEAPIQLNAFTVDTTRDRGYIAVDSLAGGRTNTPIRLTPAAMSSLTRTFIDDLRITNVRDALRWTANVIPSDPNAGRGFGGAAFHDWSFNYRNAGAGQQGGPGPTRNYFSFYQNADSYNIERIEFVRGPNSLLFGLGTVGGTLSTYTKVPRLDDSFITPILTLDNHGSVRFEVDVNQVVSERFALRVNAVRDESDSWRDGDEGEFSAIDFAFLFKVTDRTTLRLELEAATRDRVLTSATIGDKISGWDRTTVSNTWGEAPTGSARTVPIQNAGAWGDWLNPFWVYIPSLGDRALMPWAGGYASSSSLADVGQALPWQPYEGWYPDEIKLPWDTTYSS